MSHEVDHVRRSEAGVFALEIEWNNKDPFFDRDLENFKRLHAGGAISVGGIITRGTSLQDSLRTIIASFARRNRIRCTADLNRYDVPTPRHKTDRHGPKSTGDFADGWASHFVSDKFGEATTHWRKLEERVQRCMGNPCPSVLIGIPSRVLVD